MDAALKAMLAFRQPRNPEIAALNDSSLRHVDVLKPAVAFRNYFLPRIEILHKAAPELLYLGKRVRLAPLVSHDYGRAFFDLQRIGLEVPARVRIPIGCLFK